MKSQWNCFLQNLGEWQGSFTRLSPQGTVLQDTPSLLRLEGMDAAQKQVRLTLQREGQADLVLHFTTIGGGGVMFFETGAFSQGAIQWATTTPFGAELALTHDDRRLRLVQMFSPDGHLQDLTLIREKRMGSAAVESPPLRLEDLLGIWEGEAIALFPDFYVNTFPTKLTVQRQNDQRLCQELSFGADFSQRIRSTAAIDGSILRFDQGALPVQILLLPGGASANCPTHITPGHPFVLEVGWLIQPDLRQRLVRSYNGKGEWVSLTLVTEQRVR